MEVLILIVCCVEIPLSKRVDPDQIPHFAASELGLHCLLNSPKGVSGLKRVNFLVRQWRK